MGEIERTANPVRPDIDVLSMHFARAPADIGSDADVEPPILPEELLRPPLVAVLRKRDAPVRPLKLIGVGDPANDVEADLDRAADERDDGDRKDDPFHGGSGP